MTVSALSTFRALSLPVCKTQIGIQLWGILCKGIMIARVKSIFAEISTKYVPISNELDLSLEERERRRDLCLLLECFLLLELDPERSLE